MVRWNCIINYAISSNSIIIKLNCHLMVNCAYNIIGYIVRWNCIIDYAISSNSIILKLNCHLMNRKPM